MICLDRQGGDLPHSLITRESLMIMTSSHLENDSSFEVSPRRNSFASSESSKPPRLIKS